MCVLCGPGRAQAVIDHTITHPFALEPESDHLCSECGEHLSVHPDKMEFLAKRQMDVIIEHGHQIMNIFGDEDPDFSYTVGRTVKDRPELVITGDLHPDQRATILNEVAAWDDEHPLEPGLIQPDGFGVALKIVAVDPSEAEMNIAVANFGDDVVALQVIWPDDQSRFPGDPGYAYGDAFQPVFGALP